MRKRTKPPLAKWRFPKFLYFCLAIAISTFTATYAEEKRFTGDAVVTALYDNLI